MILRKLCLLISICCLASSAQTAAGDNSIYELPALQLSDQSGHAFRLASRQGQPYLLGLFYASCQQACPVQIALLKHLQKFLLQQGRPQPAVLLISFDPEHDDLAHLQALADRQHLPTGLFSLARVESGDLGMLAGALGISWHQRADGEFQHNTRISWIDAQGHVLRQFSEEDLMHTESVNFIIQALGGQALHCPSQVSAVNQALCQDQPR